MASEDEANAEALQQRLREINQLYESRMDQLLGSTIRQRERLSAQLGASQTDLQWANARIQELEKEALVKKAKRGMPTQEKSK